MPTYSKLGDSKSRNSGPESFIGIVLKYSSTIQLKQENEDSTSICAQGVGTQ